MASLVLLLILSIFLCCFCHSENQEETVIALVTAVRDKLDALSQRLEDLEAKLSTGLQAKCASDLHSCSEHATCKNAYVEYKCECFPGYSGDGITCEDVDECSTGVSRCHSQAKCENIAGNYTCTCLPGYSGDGFSCDICESPAVAIEGLGCVTPVQDKMPWEEAQENCRAQGSRLIQGINGWHLQELKENYVNLFGWNPVWAGINKSNWTGGHQVDPSLWDEGQPDGGEECGGFALFLSPPRLWSNACDRIQPSLCLK